MKWESTFIEKDLTMNRQRLVLEENGSVEMMYQERLFLEETGMPQRSCTSPAARGVSNKILFCTVKDYRMI